ncbi:hypothetical protein JCM10213v2_005166 [Rhodosporidiobolus nylandii]
MKRSKMDQRTEDTYAHLGALQRGPLVFAWFNAAWVHIFLELSRLNPALVLLHLQFSWTAALLISWRNLVDFLRIERSWSDWRLVEHKPVHYEVFALVGYPVLHPGLLIFLVKHILLSSRVVINRLSLPRRTRTESLYLAVAVNALAEHEQHRVAVLAAHGLDPLPLVPPTRVHLDENEDFALWSYIYTLDTLARALVDRILFFLADFSPTLHAAFPSLGLRIRGDVLSSPSTFSRRCLGLPHRPFDPSVDYIAPPSELLANPVFLDFLLAISRLNNVAQVCNLDDEEVVQHLREELARACEEGDRRRLEKLGEERVLDAVITWKEAKNELEAKRV